MRFFTTLVAALALGPAALLASIVTRSVQTYDGETTGRYIVKLNDKASKAAVIRKIERGSSNITHNWDLVDAFSAYLDSNSLGALLVSPEVDYVAEDGVVHTCASVVINAPWGLSRLSQSAKLVSQDTSFLNYSYTYNEPDGAGVDIYIVDTGVDINHSQFGGRARWGATFGNYRSADGHGHGTHVAGVAAGAQFGVAKAANIIAVKAVSDFGLAAISDIVSGLDWISRSARDSGRPSVTNLSLGGMLSSILDDAVSKLIATGVHVAVAAGNSNADVGNTSPARVPEAITVGAMTIADARAPFSNFGPQIDLFAPGVGITSAWIGSPSATRALSGTSMATPHVTGLIAYILSIGGKKSPKDMSDVIKSLSLKGALSSIPDGTSNNLVQNDIPQNFTLT